MKKYSILLCIIFFQTVNAQKLAVSAVYITNNSATNNAYISYTAERKLTWDDFKGKPDESINAAAITMSGFGFKLLFSSSGSNATLGISVYCNFSKKESWVKAGKKTVYILIHEQHHFDIAFISTMQFIQKLRTANFTTSDYNKEIEKIYKESELAMSKMQNEYDKDTKNSQLTDKQEEWNRKIEDQLLLLLPTKN